MDTKKLLQQLQTKTSRILVISGIAVFGGWLLATYYPTSYSAILNVYVHKPLEIPLDGSYAYDGYYAQQASEAYTDTVVGIFESGDIMAKALAAEDISLEQLRSYQDALKVQRVAPQLVEVTLTSKSEKVASNVISALASSATIRLTELNASQGNNYDLQLINQEPLVRENQLPILLLSLVCGLLGLVGSIFIFSVIIYLNHNES